MTDRNRESAPRRRFLTQLGAGAALITGGAASVGARSPRATDESPHDHWLNDLTGAHRLFLHLVNTGPNSLLPVKNFLDVYGSAYGVQPRDLNAVVGLMGAAITIAMRDEMWAKYPLGTIANFNDPATKQPATRNLLASGSSISVETLRDRGVRFLVCNMTMHFVSETVAAQVSSTAAAVYTDFRASLLPGMIVVPAMVIAVNRAQERGLTYVRLG
jgi:intracellular sulfur oxidation DsrE/DsrF family protein